MTLRTCVSPEGVFRCGIHKPHYTVRNLRTRSNIEPLGVFPDGERYCNTANFPTGDVLAQAADWIYEIPNPFPFRGTTYIAKSWADRKAKHIDEIRLPPPLQVSMSDWIKGWQSDGDQAKLEAIFLSLPRPLVLSLAATSTDPADLVRLAKMACEIVFDRHNKPTGLAYRKPKASQAKATIRDYHLFKILANNPNLPDAYKEILVLKPGVQGKSEIVGEWNHNESHVFEYLRSNSYIPWGHYAANMANDAIRYRIEDLAPDDMVGMRHLYYQRTYLRLAEELNLALPSPLQRLSENELEDMRLSLLNELGTRKDKKLFFDSTLWGWNFGFDCAASQYKLHASHQMIHQQFALIPSRVEELQAKNCPDSSATKKLSGYGCGELVEDFICRYKELNNSIFFEDYIAAIRNNQRLDGDQEGNGGLIIHEDDHTLLFVPKAQTSQWELQLMTLRPIGNILEADTNVRRSLNSGILKAMQALTGLGARMITTIELPKRFSAGDSSQRLLYSFLPKLPDSPGAFSEAQLRWINGHYPEDFAMACRLELKRQTEC